MDSELIAVVNKLQDTFASLGGELDMPQLAVVGSQSAGKSSVLETIVGRDFLPRGPGIVTRRPLLLQLVHISPHPSTSEREYAQFLHLDKRFTDFDEVRREIEQETFKVAGQNHGISKLPISLRIYSPDVLDLTLVDLPGLTKIPVGDQPSDIERQIRNLVMDYIVKPNCVILSVSPANVDLANSESLKLARAVDPQGRRTIGVLTKLDLMDAGTNAVDTLSGRVYPLKLGFIGIVNRSQQDINNCRSMKDAHQAELDFFTSHPAYRAIAYRNGSKFLAKVLNQVLMNHIREKVPDMKARLNTLMGQTQQELAALGDTYVDDQDKGSLVLRLMTEFARDFVSSIEGTSLGISTKELLGGARIYYIFNDIFGHALDSIDSTSNLSSQDIRTAIRNSTGPRPSLFVPEVAFDLLVKPQIKLLEAPSLRCVEMVYEELMKICHNCSNPELHRFPRLHAQIIEVVSELLRERLGPTSEYTSSLIAIQTAYINTNHPAFVAESHARATAPLRKQVTGASRKSDTDDATVFAAGDEAGDSEASFPISSHHNRYSKHLRPESTRHHRPGSGLMDPMASHTLAPSRSHDTLNSARRVLSASSHSQAARETFLNYFFGAQSRSVSGPPSDLSSHVDSHDIFADGTSRKITSASQNNVENAAAFDMNNLARHSEPTTQDQAIQMSAREEMETNLIRSLIASYFNIVRQSVQDLVPKAIMHFLVNNASQQVQNRLVATLYKPELFAGLLDEDEALVSERSRVRTLLEAYKDAFRSLSEVALKPSGGVAVS